MPEKMESMKVPPDMPADQEARSQVKVREKSNVAGKTGLRGGLTRCARRIQKRGDGRVQCKKEAPEQDARSQLTAARLTDTAKQATMTRETDISAEHPLTMHGIREKHFLEMSVIS